MNAEPMTPVMWVIVVLLLVASLMGAELVVSAFARAVGL